jgi:hypothetical protein
MAHGSHDTSQNIGRLSENLLQIFRSVRLDGHILRATVIAPALACGVLKRPITYSIYIQYRPTGFSKFQSNLDFWEEASI